MNTYTYVLSDGIYINLTNKCSNDCEFCIRNHSNGIQDYELWLDKEPTAQEVVQEIEKLGVANYKEVVFCGFGEPMYRYDAIKIIADYVHSKGGVTRINTNGQANLILGYDVTGDFAKYIDIVNVSLNATNKVKYQKICKSCYGESSYDAMLEFAAKCVGKCKRTILSVVDCIGADEIAAAQTIAKHIGAELRVREEI